jgi:hypothetical protein
MARPTKLTAELQAEVVSQVSAGKPLEAVCESVGIDDSTIRKWRGLLQRGEASDDVVAFFTALTRARAVGQLTLLDRVLAGDQKGESNGKAKGAQWLLERLWPNKYAPRLNVKLEEGLEVLLNDVERVCGSKDCGCYEAILARLAAREAGEGEDSAAGSGEGGDELH